MQSPFRWYLERVQLCHEREGLDLLKQASHDLDEEEYRKIKETWEIRVRKSQVEKMKRRRKMGVVSAFCLLVLGGAYFVLLL